MADSTAARLTNLAKHEIVAIPPLLALAHEMVEDAGRQYDQVAARVITSFTEKLLGRLEQGVEEDRWISVRKAARMVYRPEGTIRYWCRNNLVVARKIGPREWKIDRNSLMRRAEA